ncbi:hypothetical protein BJY04DRAFT_223851 [Aspergillus karnatakaensis]|uniref:uncharacterized protein n=1 Tax=Aspergillus karnatakaensis TaxID=1810916 RepID=UPI003CCDB0D9
MNWTGGRLRRHAEINGKSRKQTFGKPSAAPKGPHQITLFHSLEKRQTRGKGGDEGHNTDIEVRENVDQLAHPHPPSTTDAPPNPYDRLERMKRQLLEQNDWGAVEAARPVQVDFTPQEDLARFGKRRRLTGNDHERIGASTMGRPRGREFVRPEGNIPGDIEIKINGRRVGQQNIIPHQQDIPVSTSSQSMLLNESSIGSNQELETLDSLQNSVARSESRLSVLSESSYLRELSSAPEGFQPVLVDEGLPMLPAEPSDSMDWVSEPVLDPMHSTESSSIIPQPESPVRKRFTIDDQALADRQGRFMISSPVPMPSSQSVYANQQIPGLHGETYQGSSPEFASQPESRLNFLSQLDHITGPAMTTWLPSPHPGTQHSESNKAVSGTSIPQIRSRSDFAWMANREENGRPLRIYGQSVVFSDWQGEKEALLRELDREGKNLDLSGHTLDSFASGEAGLFHSRHRYPYDRF